MSLHIQRGLHKITRGFVHLCLHTYAHFGLFFSTDTGVAL